MKGVNVLLQMNARYHSLCLSEKGLPTQISLVKSCNSLTEIQNQESFIQAIDQTAS